ncbi:MAG: hypothetical protein ACRDYU_18370, partial [Actinomycetes bacterium]
MARRDLYDDVSALTHPLPEKPRPEEPGVDVDPDALEHVHALREEYAENLRTSAQDGEVDPVLAELAAQRAAMLAAERKMRLLIAYA